MNKFVRVKGSVTIFFKEKEFRLPANIKVNNENDMEQLKSILNFHGIKEYEVFEKYEKPFPLTGVVKLTEQEKNKVVVEDEEVLTLLEEYARKE